MRENHYYRGELPFHCIYELAAYNFYAKLLSKNNTNISLLYQQVAQLWQRDRAKLETFSINVQRYSQNHAQNCIFGPPYVRIGRNVNGLFESFNANKLCSRVLSREFLFYWQNIELAFLSHPLAVGAYG